MRYNGENFEGGYLMKKSLIVWFLVFGFAIFLFSGISFAGRNLSQPEYELISYSPPGAGITVIYPKGWSVKESKVEKGALFKAESVESYLYEVYRDKANPGETLDEYTEVQGNWLLKNYENYKEVDLEKGVTIGDYTGNLRKYTYTYKGNLYEVVEFYFGDQNENFYILLLDVPEGNLEPNLPLFEKLVAGVKILKTSPLSFKEFTSPQSDFTIEYPAEWKLYPPEKDVVFDVGDGMGVHIQVLVHKLAPTMSIEAYTRSSEEWLKEHLKDYKETNFGKYVKGNDLKGYMREYTYTGNSGKLKYVLEYYFTYKLEDINKGFTLLFVMPEGLDSDYVKSLRKIQKKVLDSFSLIYG